MTTTSMDLGPSEDEIIRCGACDEVLIYGEPDAEGYRYNTHHCSAGFSGVITVERPLGWHKEWESA